MDTLVGWGRISEIFQVLGDVHLAEEVGFDGDRSMYLCQRCGVVNVPGLKTCPPKNTLANQTSETKPVWKRGSLGILAFHLGLRDLQFW